MQHKEKTWGDRGCDLSVTEFTSAKCSNNMAASSILFSRAAACSAVAPNLQQYHIIHVSNSAIKHAVLVGRSSSAPTALVRRIDVGAVLK